MSSPSRPPTPESLHTDRLAEDRTNEPQSAGPRLHRRGFLQAAGFSLAAAATGCHRPPLQSARPYLEAPEHVIPGRALHYASVCGGCSAACGTLVKVRDGRPIKMEGLDEHPGSRGGLCALGQASLLSLYDALRIKGPRVDGRDVSWQEADAEIRQALASARRSGRAIRLLTPTLLGPTDRAAASRFIEATGGAHVVHDPLSASAILDAHETTHGLRVLPRYRFERADVVVSLDADFLGTWISPVEHAAAYQRRRRADGPGATRPSHHVQIESRLSLSGCNADRRLVVDPADLPGAVAILEQAVAARSGAPEARDDSPRRASARTLASTVEHELVAALEDLADLLWQSRADGGQTLVICDSDDVDAQVLVNSLNLRLGGYGTTVDLERPSLQRRGDDRSFAELLAELRAGDVGVLLVAGVDPLHELEGLGLAEDLQSVDLLVSLSPHLDATTVASGVVCPTPHFLESWGDAEPVEGWLTVRQPAIAPLFDSRSLRADLERWSADEVYEDPGDLEAVRNHWREEIYPRDPRGLDFESFWNRTVHDGFVELPAAALRPDPMETLELSATAAVEAMAKRRAERPSRDGEFTLLLYPKVGLGDGRHADNPWLHELPDPVSKVTWGNYACLSPKAAADLGVSDGDVVRLRHGETHLELPALVQPGQHDAVVAVAMGYGDPRSARFRDIGPHWISSRPSSGPDGRVGVNGARLRGGLSRRRRGVTVEATAERRELACTQRWDRQDLPEATSPSGHGERHLVRDVSLASLAAEASGKHASATAEDEEHGGGGGHHATLYPADHPPEDSAGRTTPHWGMTIDLDACTGCSACVVACQAENNLPVVGYDEVRRHRDMHWLRIDRYYDGDTGNDDGEEFDVAFQPMLCQHCDQAPCETVCPVLATVQTEEGLNAQAYNRCVGTRYCANNCPFKVRRFNWFDYRRDDPVANLVLNPDVVVRTRGVMEKCSFCVQRIENAKIEARRRGDTKVREDEVRPACQQTCPADAIRFGDVRDAESQVSESRRSPRSYTLLDELNVYPSVDYLSRVRRGAPETKREEREPRHG